MKVFENLKSVVASLRIDNIDTDMIIPKQFLKTIKRSGLGDKLFFEMRYENNDINSQNNDFVLNIKPFNEAKILLCGGNFGCGSSREHAPWSLVDFGIKCIIAESFADIFYNNCFENGILPVVLSKGKIEEIDKFAKNGEIFEINLPSQTIKSASLELSFEIESFKKKRLLEGLDSIGLVMQKMDKIGIFEEKQMKKYPWLWSVNG